MYAQAVAALARTIRRRQQLSRELARVNGQPGFIHRMPDGAVFSVTSIDVIDGRIQTVRIMRNPDKLAHV